MLVYNKKKTTLNLTKDMANNVDTRYDKLLLMCSQ